MVVRHFSFSDAIFAFQMLLPRHAFMIYMNIWSTLLNLQFIWFFPPGMTRNWDLWVVVMWEKVGKRGGYFPLILLVNSGIRAVLVKYLSR